MSPLVALVITFIVLLILAGVIINLILGDEGILSKAKHAADAYKVAKQDEENKLKESINLNYYFDGSRNNDVKIQNMINQKMNHCDFYFTGEIQEFKVPITGKYKIECWGAEGGGCQLLPNCELGDSGKGGYSSGNVVLKEGTVLYIYVGGKGSVGNTTNQIVNGGWNGGGSGITYNGGRSDATASGGGATDVRIVNGLWDNEESLLSRFIVAGGRWWRWH